MLAVVYRAVSPRGEVRRSEEHDAHRWWTPAELRASTTLTRLADAVDRAFTVSARASGDASAD